MVTDTEGKPVEGVDLTAFSLTKKFDYSAPELPQLGKTKKNKSVINNFNFKDFNLNIHYGLQLDYDAWKILAGIDSIEYYRFIYPKNSIYRFEYNTIDSITQFAPFLFQRVQFNRFMLFMLIISRFILAGPQIPRPYSFNIDSGYHQIRLRTNFQGNYN